MILVLSPDIRANRQITVFSVPIQNAVVSYFLWIWYNEWWTLMYQYCNAAMWPPEGRHILQISTANGLFLTVSLNPNNSNNRAQLHFSQERVKWPPGEVHLQDFRYRNTGLTETVWEPELISVWSKTRRCFSFYKLDPNMDLVLLHTSVRPLWGTTQLLATLTTALYGLCTVQQSVSPHLESFYLCSGARKSNFFLVIWMQMSTVSDKHLLTFCYSYMIFKSSSHH